MSLFTVDDIVNGYESAALDDEADALLDAVRIDADNETDRELIRTEHQRLLNTIKQQRLVKINLHIMGDTVQYQQAEGAERLAAKAVIAMRRQYPWLNQS